MTEDLKSQSDYFKDEPKYLRKVIDELEQENKELKSDVLKWQKAFSRQYQINENKGYSKAEENYRSALEEIREIAKFNQFYNPENLLINGDIGKIQDLKMTEIYNKINEVLDVKY